MSRAVAEAEVRVTDTRVGILTQRIQGLRKLLETGNASWLEVAAAETKLCEATSFAAASQRFRSGLLLLETDTAPAELTIHFGLPGSKAILGWVNVPDIPDLLRTEFIELIEEQSQLPSCRRLAVAAAQHRIDAVQHSISILRKSVTDHSSEIHQLQLQLSHAQAEYSLQDAEQQLRVPNVSS